jgi:hypothetical protein
MGTTENSPAEAKKTSKTHYQTLDEKITKMKVTFDNASLPEIFVIMVTIGYNAEKIDGMKAKLDQLILLNAKQVKESADQTAAQDEFDKKKAEINKVFNTHRGLLRILFKENVQARTTLQLDVENPAAYGNWNQLITKFYVQLSDPDLLAKASTVGVTAQKVGEQKQALTDLDALKDLIIKEGGEATGATNDRDIAFDELYPQYSDYVKYAKLLLPDDLLKMLGITPKAK